jgi:glycosyltransferase involved in cell wall biosynthesis
VTAVIPVYNREEYVGTAIDSILRQTWRNFELLVLDDGSTDRSAEVVRSYSDPRIRLECNLTNEGIPRTRNKAVGLARGEYLAFLDSDDWACPERLAKQAVFLDRHPDYAAVGAWSEWMDAAGRSLRRFQRRPLSPEDIAAQQLFSAGIINSTSMARTAILREYEYREEYPLCEDFDLWTRIAAKHKLGNVPQVLVRCRMHKRRISRTQAGRLQDLRIAIYAAQLHTLGSVFTATDLERHGLLRGMREQKFIPDLAYLEWAAAWLWGLREANQHAQCYPEPAFSEVLSRFWVKVCWHASSSLGWRVWLRFVQSPLHKKAWQGLRKHWILSRSFPWRVEI